MAESFDALQEWLGIPKDRRPVDYYTLLGLRQFESDPELILQSLQIIEGLIRRHLNGPHGGAASELLSVLGEARACLLDPERKKKYDAQVAQARQSGSSLQTISRKPPLVAQETTAVPTRSDTDVVQTGDNVAAQVGMFAARPQAAGRRIAAQGTNDSAGDLVAQRGKIGASYARGTGEPRESKSRPVPARSYMVELAEEKKDVGKWFLIGAGIVGTIIILVGIWWVTAKSKAVAVNERQPLSPTAARDTAPKAEVSVLQKPSVPPPRFPTGDKPSSKGVIVYGPSVPRQKAAERLPTAQSPQDGKVAHNPQEGDHRANAAEIPDPQEQRGVLDKPGKAEEEGKMEPPEEAPPLQGNPPPLPQEQENEQGWRPPKRIPIQLPKPEWVNRMLAELLLRQLGVTTKGRLDTLANRVRFAEEMLLFYTVFLELEGVPEAEKQKAREHLPLWQKRAEAKLLRLGDEWVFPEEWVRRKVEARILFEKGIVLLQRNIQLAVEELQKAGRWDPEFVSAYFVLGLLHIMSGPNVEPARNCFRRCVQRNPDHLPALNNLALVEARARSFANALSNFRRALELGGSPEVTHNLKVILLADDAGVMPLPQATKRSFGDLYVKAAALHEEPRTALGNTLRGFLYMLPTRRDLAEDLVVLDELVGPKKPALGAPGLATLRPVALGTGFFVGSRHILTNRHVVDGGDAFRIFISSRGEPVAVAEVLAKAPEEELDLAVLEADGWDGKPLPLRVDPQPVPVGTEIALLGFPLAQVLGPDLKLTRGTIAACPREHRQVGAEEYLLDVKGTFGNSGGPIVDQSGNVIGVVYAKHIDTQLMLGIPSDKAVRFLTLAIPHFRPLAPAKEVLPWEQVAARCEESVVLIQVLALPAGRDFLRPGKQKGADEPGEAALLDNWCLRCNGLGVVDCPNRRCGNGRVSTTREKILGRDPHTGKPIVVREPTTVACDVCDGRGRVPCPLCRGTRVMR
jgi:S1-C subfamily serine protease